VRRSKKKKRLFLYFFLCTKLLLLNKVIKCEKINPSTTLKLLRHLKLSGFYNFSGFVAKLVNINATVKVGKIDGSAVRNVGHFIHFSAAHETVNLYGIPFFVAFLKIEVDNGCSRVGIQSYNIGCCTCRCLAVLGMGLGSC